MADSSHCLHCHVIHHGLIVIFVVIVPWHSPWALCCCCIWWPCRHHCHPSFIVTLWHSPWASHCHHLWWPCHRPLFVVAMSLLSSLVATLLSPSCIVHCGHIVVVITLWSSCVHDLWPSSPLSSPSSPSPSSSLSLPSSSMMVMSPWHLPWPSHHCCHHAGAGAGAIVVIIRQCRGRVVAALLMQVEGWSSFNVIFKLRSCPLSMQRLYTTTVGM